jgi:hypothetical protein
MPAFAFIEGTIETTFLDGIEATTATTSAPSFVWALRNWEGER